MLHAAAMIPGTCAALATWADLTRVTVRHLGPATVVAPFDRKRAWAIKERWARAALDRLGIDVRIHRPYDVAAAARGALLVHLDQQTLLAPLLYSVAQCDIIPFMTHGELALWPRGEWRIRPGVVDLVFYPPVRTRGLGYGDRDRLVA